MTVQRTFFNWATSGLPYDRAPWESCSPNLLALLEFLVDEWGGYSLGCEGDRTIRQGTAISSHAYGAALDWRYTPVRPGDVEVSRHEALKILTWVIDNSAELHIDAIHDYFGDRIWRAGRTTNVADAHDSWWKTQNGAGSGMGEAWATYFHFETTHAGWADSTPVAGRPGLVLPNPIQPPPPPPPPPPDPTPIPAQEDLMLPAIAKTTDGAYLAQFTFRGPIYTVGDTDDHDVTQAEVFGRGGGKAYNIVDRTVVSWTSPENTGSFGAVKATKTVAQVRALMTGQN